MQFQLQAELSLAKRKLWQVNTWNCEIWLLQTVKIRNLGIWYWERKTLKFRKIEVWNPARFQLQSNPDDKSSPICTDVNETHQGEQTGEMLRDCKSVSHNLEIPNSFNRCHDYLLWYMFSNDRPWCLMITIMPNFTFVFSQPQPYIISWEFCHFLCVINFPLIWQMTNVFWWLWPSNPTLMKWFSQSFASLTNWKWHLI